MEAIKKYKDRICLMAFDEMHCISEWWVYDILHVSYWVFDLTMYRWIWMNLSWINKRRGMIQAQESKSDNCSHKLAQAMWL